jgi:hypothetical protein
MQPTSGLDNSASRVPLGVCNFFGLPVLEGVVEAQLAVLVCSERKYF